MTFKWNRHRIGTIDPWEAIDDAEGEFVYAEDAINREAVNAAEIATLKAQLKAANKTNVDLFDAAKAEQEKNRHDIRELKKIVWEVHSWAVCAPIASADDMMQNIGRIIAITEPK
jgi:hypothetical protein